LGEGDVGELAGEVVRVAGAAVLLVVGFGGPVAAGVADADGEVGGVVRFGALPNVRLGIIGFETAYVVAPAHGFWPLDDDRVMMETFSAELNLAQPQEIELYRGIFDQQAAVASYSRAARAILTRVIDDLSPEVPEGSA
jgi:hypothetical protein